HKARPLQRTFDVRIGRPHPTLELSPSHELVGYPSLSSSPPPLSSSPSGSPLALAAGFTVRRVRTVVGAPGSRIECLTTDTHIPAPTYHRAQARLDVEERRGRWTQRSWAASVLTFQAILRR